MISLELSSIQQKDAERAMLAQAIAEFEGAGRVIQRVPTSQSLFNPFPFNGGELQPSTERNSAKAAETDSLVTKRNQAIKIQKSAKKKAYEAEIAEKLKAYYDAGVVAAAKDLRISPRRVSYIAAEHGVKFANRQSAAAIAEEKDIAVKIKALAGVGKTQQAIADALGMGRQTVKRIAGKFFIRFRSEASLQQDLILVERIKAIRDIGCNRAQCARQMDINPKVLIRLIAEHQIDFPLSRAPRRKNEQTQAA